MKYSRKITVLGYLWIIFGVLSIIDITLKITKLDKLKDTLQNFPTDLKNTYEILDIMSSNLGLLYPIQILFNVCIVITAYAFTKRKHWSRVALVVLTWLVIIEMFLGAVYGSYVYYGLSKDLNVPFSLSGIIKVLLKYSLFLIPFAITIYLLRKKETRIHFSNCESMVDQPER